MQQQLLHWEKVSSYLNVWPAKKGCLKLLHNLLRRGWSPFRSSSKLFCTEVYFLTPVLQASPNRRQILSFIINWGFLFKCCMKLVVLIWASTSESNTVICKIVTVTEDQYMHCTWLTLLIKSYNSHSSASSNTLWWDSFLKTWPICLNCRNFKSKVLFFF